MANEEEESLLSLCSLEEEQVDYSDGDKDILNYISSQKSEMNDLKRRKLDSFVLQLSQSYLEPSVLDNMGVSDDLLWSVKYTPQSSDQLCLHPKKIQDVRNKLQEMIYNKNENMSRILVLNGPTGSGKSVAVKVLCNEIMNEMKKNNEMKGLKLGSLDDRLENIVEFNYLSTSANSSSYFTDFLEECKMLTGDNRKCILIEELPNLYHKETHMNFQRSILKWIETAKVVDLPPIVICITEYDIDNDSSFQRNGDASFTIENTFKIETIFGYQIMQLENIYWERITFNPVAKTYLKRALMRVANGEDLPKNRMLDIKINELSSFGDLRNSINVLEYWFKFFRGLQNEEILGKESGINLFHCVGKLIYGTKHFEKEMSDYRKRVNLNSLLSKEPSKDYNTIENINTNLLTALLVNDDTLNSLSKVNLCCLENYEKLKPDINDSLIAMLDDWSLVDSMTVSNFNDLSFKESLGLLSCLSTRVSSFKLKSTLSSGSSKLIFSRDNKTKKKMRNVHISINEYTKRRAQRLFYLNKYCYLSNQEAFTIDGYYQSEIIGSFKTRQKMFSNGYKINSIERLGGKLNESMYADTKFEVDQEQEHVYDLKDIEKQYYGIHYSKDQKGDYYSGEDDPLEYSADDSFSDDEYVGGGERGTINSSGTSLPRLYEEDDSFSDDEMGI